MGKNRWVPLNISNIPKDILTGDYRFMRFDKKTGWGSLWWACCRLFKWGTVSRRKVQV